MPKLLRTVAIAVATILLIAVVAFASLFVYGGRKIARPLDVHTVSLALPADSLSLAEGARLSATLGCNDCHVSNYAGQVLIDAPVFTVLPAPNLTAGAGGVGSTHTVADWERAIRHGVNRDGRPLMIMPSVDYAHLTDDDLGRLIAYLQTVMPVDNDVGIRRVGPMGRVAAVFGAEGLFTAYAIDHAAPHAATVERTVSAEYGRYLANVCVGCHQADFGGGEMAGAPPGAPAAANITPAGLDGWSLEDFVQVMRTGVRPDGSTLNEAMPWPAFARHTDGELEAMWLYLRTVPAVPRE
jgi:mono/diheme cytochrome c family protein